MAEPIAIIGSACRLAGDVDSPSELWKLLQNPRDVRVEIPERRFNAKGYYHPDGDHPGSSNVLHSYLINHDLSHFDAEFFGINPIEAKSMDPQQRLLLEVVYEALEASGISMASVKGTNTGVYVGVMSTDYQSIMQRDYQQIPRYFATGTGRSMLSNRISYFFDWHGPSITLDTACSSSLVAVHIAIQGLRSGETPLTVVCGTNLIIGPENYIVESKLNMLSPDGIGKMWDQEANGYARGDAITAVILKPLSAALENGDHIESVIRETGVNQDGATTGITMPSAAQQEALIRSTYRKAGLSPTIDRPHFFEAHGTGTPAGDPVEAQAIQQTFIEKGSTGLVSEAPLFVGSIKTVLGHTEGAAGIAALLKASLAVQHSCIPPNLHLNQISQRVKPFYAGLEIPQFARKWPGCPTNQPRRVSVNSFGFGGTNAHAIIESFQEGPLQPDSVSRDPGPFAPILFSAASERSLRATLAAYEAFLGENANLDIHNLAWTLRERRSLLPYRASFAATSTEELRDKIAVKIQDKDVTVGTRHGKGANKLLGIFTGQGAQYVGLGAEYLARSAAAQKIMQQLDASLARLPEPDRPAWSLEEEILQSSPRVHEPLIAQPLCTAIQIMMTDILQLAGVTFDTVVGHSSGEIGAAYAAGRLTATDAIRVAYYRGLHASLSSDPSKTKIKGAMIAVGTSAEDAAQLCEMDEFSGRISIAAYNSSNSVTISGDEDAISELEVILDDEKKFNRRLRVDKAYHSRHMLPSVEPYLKSLRACGIQVLPFSDRCKWFSSVHNSIVDGSYHLDLDGAYWAENMIRPVLFSQALSSAISVSKPDLVCEIGPHPALKGPASQTIQEVLKTSVPYVGTFDRESNPVEAMSCALGHLWSYLGSQVKLNDYERSMYEVAPECRLIKELPRYQWDHTASHWHESRGSRVLRQNRRPVHPLLGHVCPDSTKSHVTWKNLLRLNDLEWLEGHRVQGQVVFPASAYICSALEAARLLAEDEQIRLVEVRDVVIHQALAFAENGDGIEVLVSLEHISRVRPDRIRAHFSYSAAVDYRVDELSLAASGEIELYLGTPSTDLLPERPMTPPCMISVEHERFYDFLNGIGYNFTGRFRSLGTLRRKHRMSTCVVESQARGEEYSDFFIHPAELDACFQSIIVAYSYPKDDQLTSLHLPTRIGCVRLNPALCSHDRAVNDGSSFATCHASVVPSDCQAQNMGIAGSVDAYLYEANRAAMQVQNVRLVPLLGSQDDSEKKMFSGIQWIPCNPDGFLAASEHSVGEKHYDTMRTLDRISAFYLRQFTNSVPWDSSLRTEYPLCRYLEFSQHITSLVSSGKHAWLKQQWERDTLEDVMKAGAHLSDTIDMKIIRLVGEQMPRVFRGETTMLQQFRETGVLDDYYTHGFGFRESSRWMSRIVRQIAERYPHMNILEAGAGTGGATKDIIREIDKSFLTYTFTDISPAFFETAMESFSSHGERMSFKVLDIERDVVEQGYIEGGYDLVVASFVIHATAEIHRTLRNIRKLLKPGGFLVVGEGVHSGHNRVTGGFIFGSLPGWWLGVDDGRALSPLVETAEWNETLQHCGFSGIEARPPDSFEDIMGVSLFVSQALDDRVRLLRQPLSAPATTVFQKLFVIGGASRQSFSLVHQLCAILGRRAANTYHFTSLSDGDYSLMDFDSSVISLTELDGCFFDNPTPAAFANFTKLFEDERTILWITSGRLDHQPFSNMTVGFARTAVNEERNLRVQCLDVPDPETVQPQTIAQAALRLQLYQNSTDKQRVDMLWNVESEVLIDATGQCLIPRIRYLAMPNHRYNSTRSPRTRQVDTHGATVVLQKIEDEFVLKQGEVQPAGGGSVEDVRLRTLYAVVCSLKTAIGFKFLVMGVDVETGADYVTLTPVLSSCLAVSKEALIPWQRGESSIGDSLTLLAAHLVSKPIVDSLFQGQSLLVHNPTTYLSHALSSQALDKGVKLTVTTDLVSADIPNSWLRLPPFLTQCQFTETKLQNSSCFLGLSDSRSVGNQNESMILSSLPCHCVKVMAKDIFATASCQDGVFEPELIRETLRAAIELLQNHQPKAGSLHHVEPVCIRNFVDGSWPGDPMAIIDWTLTSRLPVRFERLDCRPMFEAQRTYWMVGLSGPLGISLCDWAITQGATHIVLTSRRPKIDPNWVQGHERRGVCVTIMPCDVTDEPKLNSIYQSICLNRPPIRGVINGAMVLRDVSIRNMSFDQMSDVVKPKVLGSLYLDRIFHDKPLQFFILLSSINCIIGNPGQAHYAAANMYMCALAAQRRKRGLAATAINVGAVIGLGYIQRENHQALDRTVTTLMRLSEDDFHQIVAEGIEAGKMTSDSGPELSTGLLEMPTSLPNSPPWSRDARFSHFITILHSAEVDATTGREQPQAETIQDKLNGCKNHDDVKTVIKDAFAAQLRRMLQIPGEGQQLLTMRGNEIGLDSLVSVDIRAWFLKQFQVSVPTLQIMGSDTMLSLAYYAAERVPDEIVPQVATARPSASAELLSTDGGGLDISAKGPSSDRAASQRALSCPDTEQRQNGVESYDWDVESSPPALVISPEGTAIEGVVVVAAAPTSPPRVIVLTGASGLLGHHLVDHLLTHTAAKLICVAVRRLKELLQSGRLPTHERITYYGGDLRLPDLGLSERDKTDIMSRTDLVIHNGADTSHLSSYSALKASNVESTRYLISLCARRRIPIHYISSGGAGLFSGEKTIPEASVTSASPPADGSYGYVTSKWVCERMLERASDMFGLDVCIHRPSTIIRQGQDTRDQRARLDWVNELLTYSRVLRAVPEVRFARGALDLVSVDKVCMEIIHRLSSPRELPGGRVSYVHEAGDTLIALDQLRLIGGDAGHLFAVIPMSDWLLQAKEAGLHAAVGALIEVLDSPGAPNLPRLLKDADLAGKLVDTTKTKQQVD